MKTTIGMFVTAIVFGGTLSAAQHSSMPAGMSHEDHLRQMAKDAELKQRGGLAMGFDQDKTVHHFFLKHTGGAIEVTAKDAADAASIGQIRSHFRDIAKSFGKGLFDKPVATHAEMPAGAHSMAVNKERIRYRYEERAAGAAVMIETDDGPTLNAIHDFLRYQIVEHKTGDPLTPQQ
jgi:hypothetical protein